MESLQNFYHGSKSGIVGAIAPGSRAACDFGKGFYLGTERTQPLTLICTRDNPVLYTCQADFTGLTVHHFEPTVERAMFVAWNRGLIPNEYRAFYDARFASVVETSDVIAGKIADDRMVVVLDWFFNSFISDVGLLAAFQTLNLGDQYVCKTAAACQRVNIVNEHALTPSECQQLRLQLQNQRDYAIKAVDRIRLLHRRDGESFFEIMERESGGAK